MKRTILTVILTFFLTLTSTLTFADVIGKITAIEGNVDVLKPGQERAAPAALQQLVSEGDILRTKSNGKAEITFIDESIIRLAPNSRLQITEYLMDGGKRKSGVMNLFRGKIRAVVSKSRGFIGAAFGGSARFEVRTPTAVAGVKGTDFFVSYSMGVTGILVKDGMVDVFNPAIPGQIVRVTTGNGTFVTGDKPPSSPRPASSVEMVLLTRDTDTFGYEAPGGTPPPPTGTETVAGTVIIPSSETHTELLSDISAPVVTIAGPPPATNSSTAVFTVTFNEPVSATYTMGSFGATTTNTTSDTFSIASLPEGSHTLTLTATDAAGNVSTQTHSWLTDYTAPASLTLTGTPAAITNINNATISATATDANTVTYNYTLDGAASTGTLASLTEGSHTFVATATDAAGNISTTSYSWLTDYTAAVLAFTSSPSAITNANTAAFATSSSETVTYSYTLDGAPSTNTLAGLTEGSHIFIATATDAAGNTSTTTYSWLTDYTAPVASITPAAANPELTGATAVVNVNFGSNETAAFSYQLDGGTLTSTGSFLSLPGIAEGSHTIVSTATDTAGNNSAPASLLFDLSRYSLNGQFWGCIGNVTGTAPGEVAGIWGQTWGGWIINMNGFGNPVPNATWTLYAGGTSSDATYTDGRNNGYWLLIAPGSTDFTLQTLSGTSSFKYLSRDRLGIGTGITSGTYDGSGNYLLTDTGAGTYTETPLAWSGDIVADNNGAGLYSLDPPPFAGWLDIEGSSTGLMGGVTSPWSGTTAVNYMGTYDVLFGIGAGPPYLWTPEINSFNFNNSTNTTFDNGAYKGFIGGVWRWDKDPNGDGFIDFGTIDARLYSLYIDPAGNAGILRGILTGEHHPELTNGIYSGIFSADGTWTPTALTTGLNATTATFNVISTDYGLTSPGSGTFNGLGAITVAPNEMLTATDWRYSITGQNWGILKSIIGGDYTGPTSDPVCATAGSCDTWSLSTTVNLFQTIYGTKTDGTLWSTDVNGSNNLLGTTYGYGADIAATPNTWITVGETIGTFDPGNLVWQAVQMGVWLDTTKFLTMAGKIGTTPDTATLAALNIPFAEVGRANLSGSGTIGGTPATANMNNVIFFSSLTSPAPKIWATGDVQGTYTCSACFGGTIPVAGNGLSANLNVQTFDTAGQKWLATVNGGGTYTGPTGTMIGTNVIMEGAAAGTNTGGVGGNFSGTAAGVVK